MSKLKYYITLIIISILLFIIFYYQNFQQLNDYK